MAIRIDEKDSDAELLERVVALLKPSEPQPEKTQKKETKPERKGRRYSASEKYAILADAAQGKSSEELHKKYGISRETVSRWVRRLKQSKTANESPAPAETPTSPAPATERTTEIGSGDRHKGYHRHWREVIKVWRSRPGLGPAQIKNQLYRAGIKITVATVRKVLEENGYTPPKSTTKEVEINNYEAVRPLELVHLDFKHFYINRAKVYLLLLQDDFSRFLCGYRMTESENMNAVIETFEECVSRYGKMQSIITDAGSAFYSWNGINRFQKLVSEEYGVDQIKAKSPRSNGKIENVNKQIEKEVLDVDRYASIEEAKGAVEKWIWFYNFERTHMGLPAGMVPADRFLFGWNKGGKEQVPSETKGQIELAAWTEVLKVILANIKKRSA